MTAEQGPFRRIWTYFKRGKSELNFFLTLYNSILIIWAGSQLAGGFWELVTYSVILGIVLLLIAIVIGKYSLKKLDPVTTFINPFTQDVIIWRSLMAEGHKEKEDFNEYKAKICFEKAELILEKWKL